MKTEKSNARNGWRTVKLGEACEIVMGQSPDGSSYNFDGRGEPLLNGPTEFGLEYPKEFSGLLHQQNFVSQVTSCFVFAAQRPAEKTLPTDVIALVAALPQFAGCRNLPTQIFFRSFWML